MVENMKNRGGKRKKDEFGPFEGKFNDIISGRSKRRPPTTGTSRVRRGSGRDGRWAKGVACGLRLPKARSRVEKGSEDHGKGKSGGG